MKPSAIPPPDGPCADYLKNGSASCSGFSQNGLRTGGWQDFLFSGQLKAAGQLIKTNRHKTS